MTIISEPIKYDDNGTYYIELSWQNCDFYGSRVYQFGLLNTMHPETFDTVWDSTNDYSYGDLVSFEEDNDAAAITEKITLYADDKLVWGVEPDGTKPDDSEEMPDDDRNILYGDANCDDIVTLADAVAILQTLGNPDKYKLSARGAKNADCRNTGDGITANDALAIQMYDAKLIDKLPM